MTRLPYFLIISFFCAGLAGCASSDSGRPSFDESTLPDTAYEIHLYTDRSPDDFLLYIRQRLETEGFNIGEYSSVKKTVWALNPQIGRGIDLTMFASTEYDPVTEKTLAKLSGILGNEGGIAQWSTNDDEQAYAFRVMAEYCYKMKYDNLVYAVQK